MILAPLKSAASPKLQSEPTGNTRPLELSTKKLIKLVKNNTYLLINRIRFTFIMGSILETRTLRVIWIGYMVFRWLFNMMRC